VSRFFHYGKLVIDDCSVALGMEPSLRETEYTTSLFELEEITEITEDRSVV